MSREKDLEKYNVRTDLAVDVVTDGFIKKRHGVLVIDTVVDLEKSKKIGKKPGNYITIEFEDITDFDNLQKVKNVFALELKKMMAKLYLKEEDSCLVIGLGNDKSTPDAVGPLTASKVIVTNHLYVYNQLDDGFRRVWAITPGVMGQTGIETSDFINGLVNTIKPSFVIVIDALASSSIERVNKTIQMTDAGINPGSGIGNKRKEISKSTLGIPVIALGIPTVVDAASIVSDTIKYMYKNFAYAKANYDNPAERLKVKVNYLNKNVNVLDDDKRNLFGLVGNLSDEEVKKFIYEILNPIGYNLMVTPKEEDFLVEKLADVLSGGLNKALHKSVD